MHRWIVLVVLGCGSPQPPITEKVTVPTNMQDAGVKSGAPDQWKKGPGGFPIPGDADEGHSPNRKEDVTYVIPRNRDVVHAEVVKYMATKGYTLDKEGMLMGGYRMEIRRTDGSKFSVSITENGSMMTLMTVTAHIVAVDQDPASE